MSKNIICTLEDVTKRYGPETLLGPISLCLHSGEVLGICGANGAGKTTLLEIIAGITKADSGTVNMTMSAQKSIGYVPQDIALYPALTGKRNLEFWAGVNGIYGKQKEIRIRWLLAKMDLTEKANIRVQQYSGGMRRRLNLAAALVSTPKLLLLDEPTVGADQNSVQVMLSTINHVKEQGSSVVFISHIMDELESICDRIITLEHGKEMMRPQDKVDSQ